MPASLFFRQRHQVRYTLCPWYLWLILDNSIVDLWLHVATTTIVESVKTPDKTPFQYGIDQVTCQPYPDDWHMVVDPCLVFPGGWGNGVTSKAPGMLVRANNSDSLRTITLADEDDMAILVKPDLPNDIFFRASSFGARASCQSVNPLCNKLPIANCAGFPSTFPPFNGSAVPSSTSDQEGSSQLFIQSSNCVGNASCDHYPPVLGFFDRPPGQDDNPPMNAYNFWMQFLWVAEGDQSFGVGSGSDAVGSYSTVATMLTNCTLQFYNVTVDYNNGSYYLVDEELSNVGLSDGLALPSRLGQFTANLISNIEGRVFTDNSTDSVMAFLEQDFARLALGSAAIITNVSTDTIAQGTLKNMAVGRYPFWPVVIFVALMYLHAILALSIFLLINMPIPAEYLTYTTDDGQADKVEVSIVELAQMRLRGPIPLVSALFPSYRTNANQTALSLATDELDMFDEEFNPERLVISLDYEGGVLPRFGVYGRVIDD